MIVGTKVRVVDVKESGIPLVEGQIYTVRTYIENPAKRWGEGRGPEGPGIELEELPRKYFRTNRFEVVET